MGYQPYLFYGDGYAGQSTFAPYDKILVTAGASEVPQDLLDQLKNGGWMVIPVGDHLGQQMKVVEKSQEGAITEHNRGSFIFVPLIPGKDTNNKS
jgi:protein-L-isoaspartate(D-aspartate) O-methyltransferase